jgi:hypothetical protein
MRQFPHASSQPQPTAVPSRPLHVSFAPTPQGSAPNQISHNSITLQCEHECNLWSGPRAPRSACAGGGGHGDTGCVVCCLPKNPFLRDMPVVQESIINNFDTIFIEEIPRNAGADLRRGFAVRAADPRCASVRREIRMRRVEQHARMLGIVAARHVCCPCFDAISFSRMGAMLCLCSC